MVRMVLASAILCSLAAAPALVSAAGEAQPATPAPDTQLYAAPDFAEVRSQMLEWIALAGSKDAAVREKAARMWAEPESPLSATDILEQAVATFALAEPETARFVAACDLLNPPLIPPEPAILERDGLSPFYTANMQLFYARYLTQRHLYDEALAVLEDLDPSKVIDPASSLFFRAVCEHQLLMRKEGLETIASLLQNTEQVPVSYSTVARLMQYELEALKEKSLDEISRMMRDVERRLDHARAGQRVQKKQEEIVASLDELIKREEEKNGGGGGSGSGGQPQGNQSSSPADDSRVGGATGPGNVDPKKLSSQGGWGALPEKDQAKARNQINRNFPSHYRQAVEEYFKRINNRTRK